MKHKILKLIAQFLQDNGYTISHIEMNSGATDADEKELVGSIIFRASKK